MLIKQIKNILQQFYYRILFKIFKQPYINNCNILAVLGTYLPGYCNINWTKQN